MEDLNLTLMLDYKTITAAVLAITIVVKGLTEYFKITNGNHKRLITFAVALWIYVSIILDSNTVIAHINTYLLFLFGATGGYSYIPKKTKEIEVE